MKIGIIDAEIIGRKKHRFPNLASMKISGYHKDNGDDVELLLNYDDINKYDKVFISKVFTDTPIDKEILKFPNVEHGGTGFFYDKAEPLPYEIEHHMPDYHLYDEWVNELLENGEKRKNLRYYLDYSIGFMTRGCFRQCPFCVNQNYTKVITHSPIDEFLDTNRKYICLLDDNVLGSKDWKNIFDQLNATKKRFQFKQGMDERILTNDKCKTILESNYHEDYIFAFDNIEDKDVIIKKLEMWNKHKNQSKAHHTKFYVLCGYDRNNKYDEGFWKQDIIDMIERIKILSDYGCFPYIMRYKKYNESPYRGTYINIAGWCNQPKLFKRITYREYCEKVQQTKKTDKICATMQYLISFEKECPEIARLFYDEMFWKY